MKTYEGGCHCGAVRFSVEMDLQGAMACNCSHCGKKGFLLSFVPSSQFTLQKGEGELTEYRFNRKQIAHLFCHHCGVQSFGRGKDQEGNETIAVNVRCLDDVDLETLSVTKFDGRSY